MNKKFRYKLNDLLSGKHVWNNYVFLSDSQWWDKERMEEFRLQKLIKILNHCYQFVPAYTYLMNQSGIHPSNITSIDDIKKLPVITKKYIFENYDSFVPSNIATIKGIKLSKTTGTTGQVLKVLNDANTRSMIWGSFLRFHDWMGHNPDNLYIVFRGRNIVKESMLSKAKNHIIDLIEHSKTMDSYILDEKNIHLLTKLLEKNPKAVLRGYVLNIVDIANILRKKGLSYSIQAVSTTAEPLLDNHRKTIQDAFHCDIFDQYGCGEVGGIAYECDHHQGLHITEEHVIIDTDENNEIILTDLDNYSFPFVRYKNGDQALLSDKTCTCGRNASIIKTILGRTSDNIIGLNGLPVHWGYFHHLLIYTNIATRRNLIKFQVIQNNLNELVFNIQSDPLDKSEKETLIKILKNKLGDIHVSVNNVNNIPPDESGKFKAIISNIEANKP
jgi:phenylacetate-CoA ligase